MSDAIEPLPEIPGYRMLRRLGEGGMATVYLAEHEVLRRQVAIKVHRRSAIGEESDLIRFEQEARVIARLDHPQIVTVYEVGRTVHGRLFYAMAYLPSGDLRRQGSLDDVRVIEVLHDICDALDYAHAQGIVHRDVKPENILFDRFERPLLADFGIAFSSEGHERITGVGSAVGSAGYMSPEQARGEVIDGRADIYSLGVVLYEQLSGELPFRGNDALSIALAHQQDPVPPLPALKRHWQPIVDRMLAKRPAERYQRAGDLAEALDRLAERVAAGRVGAQRPRWLMPLAAAGAFALALSLGLLLWPREPGQMYVPETPAAQNGELVEITPEEPLLDVLSSDEFDVELRQVVAAIDAGLWFGDEDSALARLEALFDVYPGSPEALGLLDTLTEQAVASWLAARPVLDAVMISERLERLQLLFVENSTDHEAQPPRRRFEQALLNELGYFAGRFDRQAAQVLADLVGLWSAKSPAVAEAWQALHQVPESGDLLRDPDGPELVFVGSEAGAQPPFAIMRYELSRDEYAFFVSETRRPDTRCRASGGLIASMRNVSWREPGFTQNGRHPVVCVSWQDARDYAQWLSRRTGFSYRLPTLREWQLAAGRDPGGDPCRLGNVLDRTASRRPVAFGCSDGHAYTAPLGSFPPNRLNIHDLRGNVSEWVADCGDVPASRGSCSQRVYMGPSWRDGGNDLRLDMEGRAEAVQGLNKVGIRLLREL